MNILLLVIDMQQEFINENTKHLINKIDKLKEEYKNIIYTKFINSPKSRWVKDLNWNGCLTKESQKLVIDPKDNKIIEKEIYSSLNKELIEYINKNNISKIHICGIDTECCILKTALDLFENDYDVYVLEEYTSSMNGKTKHQNAIEILKRNIGENRVI